MGLFRFRAKSRHARIRRGNDGIDVSLPLLLLQFEVEDRFLRLGRHFIDATNGFLVVLLIRIPLLAKLHHVIDSRLRIQCRLLYFRLGFRQRAIEEVQFVSHRHVDDVRLGSNDVAVGGKGVYQGELALVDRVPSINPDAFGSSEPFELRPDIRSQALKEAAGEKHSRIADILEPTRVLHREDVAEVRDLKSYNKRVISGEPVTPDEIHAARVAAGQQAHRTAAANRLNAHGTARTWEDPGEDNPYLTDAYEDPFAQLPDSTNFPDSI